MNPHAIELNGRVSFSREIGCFESESASNSCVSYHQKINNFGPTNAPFTQKQSFSLKPKNNCDSDEVNVFNNSAKFKESEINSFKQGNLLSENKTSSLASHQNPDRLEQICEDNNSYVSYSENIDNISVTPENTTYGQHVSFSREIPPGYELGGHIFHESASFYNPQPAADHGDSLSTTNSPARKTKSLNIRDSLIPRANENMLSSIDGQHLTEGLQLRNPSEGGKAASVEGSVSFLQNSNGHEPGEHMLKFTVNDSELDHSRASGKNINCPNQIDRQILREVPISTNAPGRPDVNRKPKLECQRLADENRNSMHFSTQNGLSVPGRVSLSPHTRVYDHHLDVEDNYTVGNGYEAVTHNDFPNQTNNSSIWTKEFPSAQEPASRSKNIVCQSFCRENPHFPPKPIEVSYLQGVQGRVSFALKPEVSEFDEKCREMNPVISSHMNSNGAHHNSLAHNKSFGAKESVPYQLHPAETMEGCIQANDSSSVDGRVSFSQNTSVPRLDPHQMMNLDNLVAIIDHGSPARRINALSEKYSTPNLSENNKPINSIGDCKHLTNVTPNSFMNPNRINNYSSLEGTFNLSQKSDVAKSLEHTIDVSSSVPCPPHVVTAHNSLAQRNHSPGPLNEPLSQASEHKSDIATEDKHSQSKINFIVNPHSSADLPLGNKSLGIGNRVSYSVKTNGHELRGVLQTEEINSLGYQLITASDPKGSRQVTKSSKPVAQDPKKGQQRNGLPNTDGRRNQKSSYVDSLNKYQQTLDVTTKKNYQKNTDLSCNALRTKRDLEDLNSPRYHLGPDVNHNSVTDQNQNSPLIVDKMDINHNTITYQRQNHSPNPHTVPNEVNYSSPSGYLQKADVYHDSFCGHCAHAELRPHSLGHNLKSDYHNSLSGNLQATEVYHDSLGGFSEGAEDMNLSSLSGYQLKLHATDSICLHEYQNISHPMGSPVLQEDTFNEHSLSDGPRPSILKNSNVVSVSENQYHTTPPVHLGRSQLSQNLSNCSALNGSNSRQRRPTPRPMTSKEPLNRNPHAVLPSITSPKPSSRPNSSNTPRLPGFSENTSFPPIPDRVRHNRSVIWDILSEATDEDTYSLYSYSSGTGSYSDESLRGGSARRREETKRQRYWNWTQSGLTVDELARHRRKRPPSSQKPRDSLKVLEGSFAHLKTEYRRRYRRNSSILKSLDKLKPEDLLRLEGELKCSAEYNEEFVAHPPSQREKLLRRPTSLKLEGPQETSTEVQEKFKYEEAEKSLLIKQEASLKPEGELLVKVSEVHDRFIEFPGVKRPELTRKPTSLKLEGLIETCTEAGENFVAHPPQPLAKPILRDPELSSTTSPMAHEVTTEYRPEYKENYIAFEAKRPIVKKPEGSLKPEGTIEASTELKSEFKDFHPSRPVLHRNNSLLKPSGDFAGESEKRSEFRDFHPARPTIHRNNSLLKPSGEFERTTEKGSEYRDFHPSRPVLQRNNSQLRPSGDMAKTSEVRAEYKNFSPKRPIIHRVDSKLKPEGDMAKTTEVKSEYRDFHPSRPVLHRTPSHLAMEGQMEKESEIRAEYRDFHPSRPVIYRKNSLLKPEGDIETSTEVRSEYKDFHPSRPTIHRNNSLLKPEGETGKESEVRSEYKDFHPSRPVIHRKNSMLHPEGDFAKDTEKRSEYKDFHQGRPIIHRKNSMLHPEGDFAKDTEKGSEYKDFHPSRPTIHRNNSLLHPEGDLMNTDSEVKHEYKDHKPKRPTIYTENCNLKPGNRIEERNRALTPKSREYYVLEGEITIRPERSGGRTLENIKNEERTSTAGRRLPGTSTLPRSRAVKGLLPDDNTQITERPGPFRFTVENVDDATRDKAFVVLQDNNNNISDRSASYEDLPEFQNRWLRGSLRERAEPWRPSWALNPNTKDVTTT